MKKTTLSIVLLLILATYSNAQSATHYTWVRWQFLIGDWQGAGTGKPGDGAGEFSLQPGLDDMVLIRKNHTDYPESNGHPAFSHDDLMIIYPGNNGGKDSAIYFDNEGHVINYGVYFNDSTGAITLLSPPSLQSARFRLTYTPVEKDKVNIKFEIAPSGIPDGFSTYIDASATRKK